VERGAGGRLSLHRHSYDNTGALGASTWRHVKFVEQSRRRSARRQRPALLSWQFSSDVCKHCENAGCLEACPTGAIVRTEFGGVFIQPDVCNGCGYCVVGCPFGVIDKRHDDGRAFKCTFCYDRQLAGLQPACAKACPTQSILFGELDELRRIADERVETLHARGMTDAVLWDARDSSVRGVHAFFLLRGDPRAYNLPLAPEVPTGVPARWLEHGAARRGRDAARRRGLVPARRRAGGRAPVRRPDAESERRLDELRREGERGDVRRQGVRPAGAPFPVATPATGYYGRPLLHDPTWTWEVPLYFFVGGAAGAAAVWRRAGD
jgi:formate dehydrogenase iron-sulfur subunit